MKWKADKLLDFAVEKKLDSILFSDLDVFESHESTYLNDLRKRAQDNGILIHAGTGGICPTSEKCIRKWGSPAEHLGLGIRVAKDLGSPVFRCYLGSQKDRSTAGGIRRHIDSTVKTLRQIKTKSVDANVKIGVENHAGDMQAEELVQLIEMAGTDYVGATIDSGNATWTLEHPQTNLELLGKYAVSSGIRDSTIWQTDKGASVAWNAVGEGQIDWKKYVETWHQMCPDVPFQLEIISGFDKSFPFHDKQFWNAYPDVKAIHFAEFLGLARVGKPVPKGNSNLPDFQLNELLKSIHFCQQKLGIGLKTLR
ncbi:MAG: TIM barrel protein [Planctomycetota bacterium]